MITNMLLHVIAVECVGPCTLRVWFDDETIKDVDFSGELWGEVFEPMRDPEFFLQASVNAETGTVEWPNGADVAPGFLHERGVPV